MKLPWDKNYLKISFHVIVTIVIIYCLGLMVTFLGPFTSSIRGTISWIISLLSPLIIGIILAYILDPLVEWYEQQFKKIKIRPPFRILKGKRKNIDSHPHRRLATLCTFLTVLIFIGLFVAMLLYSVTSQLTTIGNFDEVLAQATKQVESINGIIEDVERALIRYNISSEQLQEYIRNLSENLLNAVQSIGVGIITYLRDFTGHLAKLLFALIISIYLLLDKHHFLESWNQFLKAILPKRTNKKVHSFWKELDHILAGYIRGQMLDALVMCFLLSFTLYLVGIKFAVIIGITAGLANLIPYFGPLVAYVLAIGMAIITGEPMKALYAFLALAVVQQIDGTVIGPRLLGNGVQLHPVFVLLSVIIGGAMYGLLGMLFAVPVAAVIRLFLKRFIDHRLEHYDA